MCVFACSLVADKASLCSELSECKQSKSILKVMTMVMPWLRDIFHLKPKPIAISVLFCKLCSCKITLKPSFLIILHAYIGIQACIALSTIH